MVEHDLAKVGVAGSSPVSRSVDASPGRHRYFGTVPNTRPGGEMVDTRDLKSLGP